MTLPAQVLLGLARVFALSKLFTTRSLLSVAYMTQAMVSCLPLLRQLMPWAFCLARPSAGSSMAARMAMMAMTTSNSISVKPDGRARRGENDKADSEEQFAEPIKIGIYWPQIMPHC